MKSKDLLLVILQFLLFILFAILPPGFGPPFLLPFFDFLLTVAGILIIFFSLLKLKSNLTPFPTPRIDGKLETGGFYKFIRHPIYTGILLTALGISLYSASQERLAITLVLYFLFLYKSSYEEKMLILKYPEYQNYKKTTGRFIPKMTFLFHK